MRNTRKPVTVEEDEVFVDVCDQAGFLADVEQIIAKSPAKRKQPRSEKTLDIQRFYAEPQPGPKGKPVRMCKECKYVHIPPTCQIMRADCNPTRRTQKLTKTIVDAHTTLGRHSEIYHEVRYDLLYTAGTWTNIRIGYLLAMVQGTQLQTTTSRTEEARGPQS